MGVSLIQSFESFKGENWRSPEKQEFYLYWNVEIMSGCPTHNLSYGFQTQDYNINSYLRF